MKNKNRKRLWKEFIFAWIILFLGGVISSTLNDGIYFIASPFVWLAVVLAMRAF